MALLIQPSGALQRVTPANGTWTLSELQGFVGGYIEQVRMRGWNRYLIVNEDGKSRGFVPNPRASHLLWRAGGMPSDFIVGPAVLVTLREMNGDDE
jgi:hypothetical protein